LGSIAITLLLNFSLLTLIHYGRPFFFHIAKIAVLLLSATLDRGVANTAWLTELKRNTASRNSCPEAMLDLVTCIQEIFTVAGGKG